MANDGRDKPRTIPSPVTGRSSTVVLPCAPPEALHSEYYEDEVTDIRGMPWNDRTMARLPSGVVASITVVHGPKQIGATFPLKRTYNSIGRQRTNDVPLRHGAVSSRHAAIYYTEAQEWRILDLQSTNGTLLNGSRVREFAIRSGDRVGIADYLLEFKEGK